ncbi:hypothetical protein HPB51_013827 [Rhipicephalus microplus]|uniref:Peptidase M13 N-terminal domain-containing protein n=1 Tax=Rhipicephalus microplus TaxID=6941 RepID=A0A9J6F3U3_RHIMP|nr:hypothetical protein HPB51_013827 [Rhipicephalus microplus]
MARKRKPKDVSLTTTMHDERETSAPASPAEPVAPASAGTRKEKKLDQPTASYKKAHRNKATKGDMSAPTERVQDTAVTEPGSHPESGSDDRARQPTTKVEKTRKKTTDADHSPSQVPNAEPAHVAPTGPELPGERNGGPAAGTGTSEPTASRARDTSMPIFFIGIALLALFIVLSRALLPATDDCVPLKETCIGEPQRVPAQAPAVEYSRHLQRSLSTKTNPCFNFYRYVCGTSESILTMTSERLKTEVLRAWIDDRAFSGRNGTNQRTLLAASLFRSCVSGDGIESGSSSDSDLLEVLVDWTFNWNVDVWFSLRVILADTSRRNFTFHVRHSASLQRWSKERASMQDGEQYMAFVTAYARELGARESEELDPMVMDVVEAEPKSRKFSPTFLGTVPSNRKAKRMSSLGRAQFSVN